MPSITGLPASGADVAEPEHRGAVGDHRHEVALVGVLVGQLGILGDLEAGFGHAGRVGQRQVALGEQGLVGTTSILPCRLPVW